MTEADLALEADDDDLGADWLLGSAAARLDTQSGAVELADGTGRGRWRRDRHRVAGTSVARLRTAGRCARDPHRGRCDRAPGRPSARSSGGRHRRRVHRRGGCVTARKLGLDVTVVGHPSPIQVQLGTARAVVAAAHATNGTTLIWASASPA